MRKKISLAFVAFTLAATLILTTCQPVSAPPLQSNSANPHRADGGTDSNGATYMTDSEEDSSDKSATTTGTLGTVEPYAGGEVQAVTQ